MAIFGRAKKHEYVRLRDSAQVLLHLVLTVYEKIANFKVHSMSAVSDFISVHPTQQPFVANLVSSQPQQQHNRRETRSVYHKQSILARKLGEEESVKGRTVII